MARKKSPVLSSLLLFIYFSCCYDYAMPGKIMVGGQLFFIRVLPDLRNDGDYSLRYLSSFITLIITVFF